jgi:hypothetical protein
MSRLPYFILIINSTLCWSMQSNKKAFLYQQNQNFSQISLEKTLPCIFNELSSQEQKKILFNIIKTNNINYIIKIIPSLMKHCYDCKKLWTNLEKQWGPDDIMLLFLRAYCNQQLLLCSNPQ